MVFNFPRHCGCAHVWNMMTATRDEKCDRPMRKSKKGMLLEHENPILDVQSSRNIVLTALLSPFNLDLCALAEWKREREWENSSLHLCMSVDAYFTCLTFEVASRTFVHSHSQPHTADRFPIRFRMENSLIRIRKSERSGEKSSDRITSCMWLTYIVFRFCPRIFYPFRTMCCVRCRLVSVLEHSTAFLSLSLSPWESKHTILNSNAVYLGRIYGTLQLLSCALQQRWQTQRNVRQPNQPIRARKTKTKCAGTELVLCESHLIVKWNRAIININTQAHTHERAREKTGLNKSNFET